MFQPISSNQTIHTNSSDFASLQQSEKPILVKFVAPHCAGCVTLKPILDQLVREQSDNLNFVEIDITEDPELALELDIRSVPTVVLFAQENELGRLVGLQPKKHYANLVQQAI